MKAALCCPDKKHYAKELCSACYRKTFLSGYRTKTAATCHPDQAVHARGLCGACYQALRASASFSPRAGGRVNECGHPDREHEARGLCKKCYTQAYRAEKGDYDRRARRDYRLRKDYGLSAAEVDDMYAAQGRKCKLCDSAIPTIIKAHVDHCHDTGRVRGILCFTCNKALGMLGDNEQGLLRALAYVRFGAEQ